MRTLVFILLGLVAVYAAPVENDLVEQVASLDVEGHLAPVDADDEEVHLAKRTIPDETLEDRE